MTCKWGTHACTHLALSSSDGLTLTPTLTGGANYDPSVDQEIIVGECGLAPGVEITLCTAASAYGSVHA